MPNYKDGMNLTVDEKKEILFNNKDNIIGQKFGRLTVIDIAYIKNRKIHWVCECDCEYHGQRIARATDLRNGNIASCKECKKENHFRTKDLTGQRFGKLTVLRFDKVNEKTRGSYWICECDCKGPHSIKSVSSNHLKDGSTKSCGYCN